MEQELRETILEDSKRLMRESKKLIKQSRENLQRADVANQLSDVFGETKPKRKSKAAAPHPAIPDNFPVVAAIALRLTCPESSPPTAHQNSKACVE